MAVGVAALLGVGAHAEVAVADGEQRLGQRRGRRRRTRARRAATGRPGSGAAVEVVGCRRLTAGPRPAARRGRRRRRRRRARSKASRPAPRSTPTTSPKPPACPAATPDTASSTTTARAGVDAEQLGGGEEHVGRRLAGDVPASAATTPSTTTSNAVGQPGGVEHLAGVARRRHDGHRVARAVEVVEQPHASPGTARCPRVRSSSLNSVVLAVAERADACRRRAGRRVALGQRRCRARRGTRARRRSGACRRRRRGSRRSVNGVVRPRRRRGTRRTSSSTPAGGSRRSA